MAEREIQFMASASLGSADRSIAGLGALFLLAAQSCWHPISYRPIHYIDPLLHPGSLGWELPDPLLSDFSIAPEPLSVRPVHARPKQFRIGGPPLAPAFVCLLCDDGVHCAVNLWPVVCRCANHRATCSGHYCLRVGLGPDRGLVYRRSIESFQPDHTRQVEDSQRSAGEDRTPLRRTGCARQGHPRATRQTNGLSRPHRIHTELGAQLPLGLELSQFAFTPHPGIPHWQPERCDSVFQTITRHCEEGAA